MIDHIDGTVTSPNQFLLDNQGNPATTVNPEYHAWKIKDKALLSMINSALTPFVFSLVVGVNNVKEVWKTLEQRFTSTSKANILNSWILVENESSTRLLACSWRNS